MQKDLTQDMVHSALKREEINRKPRASSSSDGAALKATSLPKQSVKCDFCDYTNHITAECRSLKRYKQEKKAKGASTQAANASTTVTSNKADTKTESAGNASLRSSDPNWTVSNDWIVV
ncbi:hypothetical protein EIP91_009856 [Steccherinum ochraceum]|uniref:Uncharacterized protein n=1 Tax=Steccherinum ochraceum TaxID=92696 RepID=A0A4R0R3T0_9APHY|nr:hypothetical protein EIP91_009856 [Steccherinum ochraceum]